jgi:hypothetical protein
MDGDASRAPPPSFSWRHPESPRANFAADPIDQHAMGWCGLCYVVAALQSVEDRAHVLLGRRERVDPNVIVDYFQAMQSKAAADAAWNVCHGGNSIDVMQCMQDKLCPLLRAPPRAAFRGFAALVEALRADDRRTVPFEVVSSRRVPAGEVRHELRRHGPLVLEISARTVKSTNASGVVTDRTPRAPDHAVSVVGWQGGAWICRNSWGARVPREVPEDFAECVGVGYNYCEIDAVRWRSLPHDAGFFLLPEEAVWSPHPRNPSPWIAAYLRAAKE